jgi:hypothetical protein
VSYHKALRDYLHFNARELPLLSEAKLLKNKGFYLSLVISSSTGTEETCMI